MVAAVPLATVSHTNQKNLTSNDLRNVAIGLAAAIALILVASQIAASDSASVSALEETSDKRFTCSFTSANTASPNEAQTDAQTVTATASGGGNTCTFTNTGGADTADFTISGAGDLNFAATPDHENPVDANTDNAYVVIITATDSADGNTATQSITITVQDVTLAITDKTVSLAETASTGGAVTTPTIADIPDTCQTVSYTHLTLPTILLV